MKKLLFLAIVIVAGIIVWQHYASQRTTNTPVLGQPENNIVYVTVYTGGGVETGKLLIQIPFVSDLKAGDKLNVAIDTSGNGVLESGEYVITDHLIRSRENLSSGYYAATDVTIQSDMQARVVVAGRTYNAMVEAKRVEVGNLMNKKIIDSQGNLVPDISITPANAQDDENPED